MLHGRIFNGDLEININDVNNHIPLSNHVDSTRHQLVRAECVRCHWLQAETKVATILGNYSTLVLTTAIQNHRRGCRRVPKFCMGS